MRLGTDGHHQAEGLEIIVFTFVPKIVTKID